MVRKMQRKAMTALPQVSDKAARLMLDTTIMVLMAAVTIWLLMMPVDAAEPSAKPGEPLTIWTESIPSNFQTEAARYGLDVIAVERLNELDSYIVTIHSVRGLSPLNAVQVLGSKFPAFTFDMMNGTEDDFEVVEN